MRNLYPVAVHLFFVRGDQVMLLRRYNTGWRDGEYSVPAGHVEAGETVTAAAIREAREEVGVTLEAGEVRVVHVMHRNSDDERIDFFVAVRSWEGEARNAEPDKCDDLHWCAMEALPRDVIPYVAYGLACWRAGVGYSEFGW
jgi:8-oxo-dGTP diphosphatase